MRQLLILVLGMLCLSAKGQADAALQRLLSSGEIRNAMVGISVRKVADGSVVVAHNAAVSLTPASVAKIIPTWFALQEKGADYRFQTSVFYSGKIENGVLTGDILIRPGGDPCLESRYFTDYGLIKPLADCLEKAGIHRILGKIRVEGGEARVDIPGSWTWEDISNYYAALCFPFNYRDNTYTIEFKSGKAGSPARLVSVVPALPDVRVRSEVTASDKQGDDAWIYGGPYASVLCVKGTIPQNRASFRVKGAMHHPVAVFLNEFGDEIRKRGLSLEGREVKVAGTTLLTTLTSPRLEEIVFYTNKRSVNLFAEALGKLLGGEDKWPEKAEGLFRQVQIATEGVILKDACGLSPQNALPAQVFTDLLIYAARHHNEAFSRSLPVAGVDGGLNGYIASAPLLKNNLKAKTGSMSGIRCLSGYLTTSAGEQLAFTILINHYTCTSARLQQAVGQFLTELFHFPLP